MHGLRVCPCTQNAIFEFCKTSTRVILLDESRVLEKGLPVGDGDTMDELDVAMLHHRSVR